MKDVDAGAVHAIGAWPLPPAAFGKETVQIMATHGKGNGKAARLAGTLAAGAGMHYGGTTSILLSGDSYTHAEVAAKLRTIVALRAAVDDSKAATKGRLAEEAAAMPSLRGFMAAFEMHVRAAYGNAPDVLADFGLEPKNVPDPAKTLDKAAAVAKRAATRKARHTMGSRQKQAVKGGVTGVTVIPVTSAPPTGSKGSPP